MADLTILVTPEVMRSKAANVRTYRSQHDEAIARLRTLVNGLEEIWKGSAQAAFAEKFSEMQSTFTQFSEAIEQYAVAMEQYAARMEEADHL